jgi:hypothetical protein
VRQTIEQGLTRSTSIDLVVAAILSVSVAALTINPIKMRRSSPLFTAGLIIRFDTSAHSSNRPLAILSSSRIGSWVAPAATRGRSAAAATGTIAAREIRKIESFLAAA